MGQAKLKAPEEEAELQGMQKRGPLGSPPPPVLSGKRWDLTEPLTRSHERTQWTNVGKFVLKIMKVKRSKHQIGPPGGRLKHTGDRPILMESSGGRDTPDAKGSYRSDLRPTGASVMNHLS